MPSRQSKSDATNGDGLPAKVRSFCLAYLENRNATQAAIHAGYSKASAASQASRLLRKAKVKAFIATRTKKLEEKSELTVERLERELCCITFFDPRKLCDAEGNFIPLHQLPEEVARAVPGVDVEELWEWVDDPKAPGKKSKRVRTGSVLKYRFPNKTDAIQLGMRRRGALIDNLVVAQRTHAELVAEAVRRAREQAGERRAGGAK